MLKKEDRRAVAVLTGMLAVLLTLCAIRLWLTATGR